LSSTRTAASEPHVAGELYATEIRAANELRTGGLHGIELRAGIELRIDEPRFAQATRRCCIKKRMLQVYVLSVSEKV
jgi:hypothetical protein